MTVDEYMTLAEMQSRYYAGATLFDIAQACGKSQTYVWRHLVEYGTEIRHRGPKGHRPKTVKRIKRLKGLLARGLTVATVARMLGITRQAVYQLRQEGASMLESGGGDER